MRVTVEWESAYRYDQPVRILHTELRVMPWSLEGQRLLDASLTVDPSAPMTSLPDAFGNTRHCFDLLGPVTHLSLRLHATVETGPGVTDPMPLRPLHRYLSLQPTRRAPFDPAVLDFAREAGDATDPLAYMDRLMDAFRGRFDYQVGHTLVQDTGLTLLERRRGVCQDFAHLMLAALRSQGIPSQYVSGYLAPDEGETVGEASHAWVRIYAGGAWHGFDASNDVRQDERYVVTAVGRDYDDVAPLRGSYRGAAEESWHASVRVQSTDTAAQ